MRSVRVLVSENASDQVIKLDVFKAIDKLAYLVSIWALFFICEQILFFHLVRNFKHIQYDCQVDKHFALMHFQFLVGHRLNHLTKERL